MEVREKFLSLVTGESDWLLKTKTKHMKFIKFWEDLTKGISENSLNEVEKRRELLQLAYNVGYAEGITFEQRRQAARRYDDNAFEMGYKEVEKDLSERFNLK